MLARLGRTRRSRLFIASAAVAVAAATTVLAIVALRGGGAEDAPAATTSLQPTATLTNAPTAAFEASPTPVTHAGILDGAPMTDEERAEYDRLRAEEMARAERRREPSPQLEFGDQ